MHSMKIKPTIRLWDSKGLGLIILMPSGVNYTNQVGGHCCLQPQAEGVFIPLLNEVVNQEEMLYNYFVGSKWHGWCSDNIDDETADFIDNVLSLSTCTKILKVDRTKYSESCEAWIYVDIENQPDEPLSCYWGSDDIGYTVSGKKVHKSDYNNLLMSPEMFTLYGFGKSKGILTWANSD